MSIKKKNKQEDIKSLTHVTLVDENGKRIQPRWIKELEKLSPVRKMILKMKFVIRFNRGVSTLLFFFLLIFIRCNPIGLTPISSPTNYEVRANIHLPANCLDKNFYMWLLDDYKFNNEGIMARIVSRIKSTCPDDTIFTSSIEVNEKGNYFLCALVTNKTYSFQEKLPILVPESGEYFGFYGSGFLPPKSPNVWSINNITLDLYLKEFP